MCTWRPTRGRPDVPQGRAAAACRAAVGQVLVLQLRRPAGLRQRAARRHPDADSLFEKLTRVLQIKVLTGPIFRHSFAVYGHDWTEADVEQKPVAEPVARPSRQFTGLQIKVLTGPEKTSNSSCPAAPVHSEGTLKQQFASTVAVHLLQTRSRAAAESSKAGADERQETLRQA